LEGLAEKQHLAYNVGAIECSRTPRDVRFCPKMMQMNDDDDIEYLEFPQFGFVKDGKVVTLMKVLYEDMTVKDLHEFAMTNMPKTLIDNINAVATLQKTLLRTTTSRKKKFKPGVLLLTDKYETSSMYYSLVYHFRNKIHFGESRAKNLAVSKEFQVKQYPQLILFVPAGMAEETYNDEYGIIRYTGKVKKAVIVHWLEGILDDIDAFQLLGGGGGEQPDTTSDDESESSSGSSQGHQDDESWFGSEEL
jgi:hypothetical protein